MARYAGIWYHPTTGKAVHLWEGFDPWCFFLPPFIPMAVRGIWLGPGAAVATLMVDVLVTGLGAVLAGPTGGFIAGLRVRFWYGANANSDHWMHREARSEERRVGQYYRNVIWLDVL